MKVTETRFLTRLRLYKYFISQRTKITNSVKEIYIYLVNSEQKNSKLTNYPLRDTYPAQARFTLDTTT